MFLQNDSYITITSILFCFGIITGQTSLINSKDFNLKTKIKCCLFKFMPYSLNLFFQLLFHFVWTARLYQLSLWQLFFSSILFLFMPNLKYPCATCSKPCKSNQKAIFCDICLLWVHLKCTKLTSKEFTSLGQSSMPYYCENCYADIFPYHHLDSHEFFENALTNQDVVTFSIPVPQLSDGDTPNFYQTV